MDLCDQERKPTGDKNRTLTRLLLLGLLRTLEPLTAAITTCANRACPSTNLQLLSGNWQPSAPLALQHGVFVGAVVPETLATTWQMLATTLLFIATVKT